MTGAPRLPGQPRLRQCERVWGLGDWPEGIAAWFRLNGVRRRDDRDDARAGPRGAAADPLRSQSAADGRRRPGRRLGRDRAAGPRGRARRARPRRGARRGRHICFRTSLPPSASIPSHSRTRSARTCAPSSGRSCSPRASPCPRTASRSTTPPVAPARSSTTIASGSTDTRRRALRRAADGLRAVARALSGRAPPSQRRFAVAETLAHLERLVATGEATRKGTSRPLPILSARSCWTTKTFLDVRPAGR